MRLRKCPGPILGMRTCDCKHRVDAEMKTACMNLQKVKQRNRCSLFIEGAAAAGRGAIFKEGLRELLVEVVRHWPGNSLPCQDEDHQHRSIARVSWPLTNQTQQFLLFAASPDHLLDDFEYVHIENKQVITNEGQTKDSTATQTFTTKTSISVKTVWQKDMAMSSTGLENINMKNEFDLVTLQLLLQLWKVCMHFPGLW